MKSTEEIYNAASDQWVRNDPQSLSDFTARPFVFDLCGDVTGHHIVDLGCGEGYCAREMLNRGASRIDGLDISEKMVAAANGAADNNDTSDFKVGTVTDLQFEDESFDLALGVFVYNYLGVDDTARSFKEVFRVLKPGAAFVFSVPHPSFPFIHKDQEPPFFFDMQGAGYFSGRDVRNLGEIHRRDGKMLPVEMNHKLIEDYFNALGAAGFNSLPIVRELKVLKEHVEFDKDFFSPLWDKPLHMAFRIEKPV